MNKGICTTTLSLNDVASRSIRLLKANGCWPCAIFGTGFSRQMRRLALWTAVTVLLCGCAAPQLHTGQAWPMLAPAALGESISLQQHLRVERNGRVDEIDVALEVDPKRLDLVGLAMGQRVLTLHYDGKALQSWRHFMLPPQVRAEDVLEDLQLAFWPAEVLRGALPFGWRLEEDGLRRTLFSGGEKVTEIVYSGQPRWIGTIKLMNMRYNYHLTIQSVSTEP